MNKLNSFLFTKCEVPFLNVADNLPNKFMAEMTYCGEDQLLPEVLKEIDVLHVHCRQRQSSNFLEF